jgi:rubrerythrin
MDIQEKAIANLRKELWYMGDEYSIQEVIEIAIEIEKNGAAFYSALAQSADTERLRELYIYLSQEEKRHITRFQEILESVGGYQISEAYYATQYMGYMKALADERVFKDDTSVKEAADRANSPEEAIKMAIDFEKESILFLHEMYNLMPEADKSIVQKLLDEERDHLRRLSAIKTQIES